MPEVKKKIFSIILSPSIVLKQGKSPSQVFFFTFYMQGNTWACVDIEFLFECSTRYLTSERSELVRYQVEHEKGNSISTINHVLFCLLIYLLLAY